MVWNGMLFLEKFSLKSPPMVCSAARRKEGRERGRGKGGDSGHLSAQLPLLWVVNPFLSDLPSILASISLIDSSCFIKVKSMFLNAK